MRTARLLLLLAVATPLLPENILKNQIGVAIPAGDVVDITSTVGGIAGIKFPQYVTGWDALRWNPILHALCGILSYFQQSSEPNQNPACYSFERNVMFLVDIAGGWHNEHLQEGGHSMGDMVIDPTTSMGLGFFGNSGSQVANQTKWGSWKYDYAAQLGIPQQSKQGINPLGQLGTSAYDASRQLQIGFDSMGGMMQFDNNASHTTCVTPGVNCYNSWTLQPSVTYNGLPAAIEETSMAWNVVDAKTYLFGGFGSAASHNFVYTYTPGAGGAISAWINLFPDSTTSSSCHDRQGGNNCPTPRILASFTHDAKHNIFLMAGGVMNATAPISGGLTDLWIFDPVAVTWTQVANDITKHVFAFNEVPTLTSGAILSTDTTFTLASNPGDFVAPATIQIDDAGGADIRYCTTLTVLVYSGCTPGFENSTPANHLTAATAYISVEPSSINERFGWIPEDDVFVGTLQPTKAGASNHVIAFRHTTGGNGGYVTATPTYTIPSSAAIGPLNRNTTSQATPSWAFSESIASDGVSLYVAHTETGTTQGCNGCYLRTYVQQFTGNLSAGCGTLDKGFSCLGASYSSVGPDGAGAAYRQAFDISLSVIGGKPWPYFYSQDQPLTTYGYGVGWDGSGWNSGGVMTKVSAAAAYDGPGQMIGVAGVPTVIHQEQDHSGAYSDGNQNPYEVKCYVRQWNGSAWVVLGAALNTGYTVCDGASIATDGTSIWAAYTLYGIAFSSVPGSAGTWFGPPQVFLVKWNGSSWVQQGITANVGSLSSCTGGLVGNPPTYVGTTCTRAYSTSLTILGGLPYVAFNERTDLGILQKLWVRVYNGSWATVGSLPLNRDQSNGWTFRPELINDGLKLIAIWAEQGNPQPWIGGSAYPGNSAAAQKAKVYSASITTGGSVTYLGGALNVDPVNGSATHPSITIYQGQPAAVWGEVDTGSTRQVYVKEWNGMDWAALKQAVPPSFGFGGMSILDLFTGVWHP